MATALSSGPTPSSAQQADTLPPVSQFSWEGDSEKMQAIPSFLPPSFLTDCLFRCNIYISTTVVNGSSGKPLVSYLRRRTCHQNQLPSSMGSKALLFAM